MKIFVKGLNPCAIRKINIQRYRDFLIANGHQLVKNPAESDIILLWTCGVRNDFRKNSMLEANRYGREYNREVVLAGCLPDIDPQYVRSQFSGIIINWRDDSKKMEDFFGAPKQRFADIPLCYGEKQLCDSAMAFKMAHPQEDACFHDESIKLYVSEGCGFECTFCSERLMFPPYRSFPEEDLVETCRRFLSQDKTYKVMLHADNVGDYGIDIGTTLPCLIRKLKAIHPKVQVGIQGFNPAHFLRYFDELSVLVKDGTIWNLRLPIQSASSRLLNLMKRPYTSDDIHAVFSFLNSVKFTDFATDMIVGFPSETEEEHEETIRLILHYRPRYVLLSAFMSAPGLAALQFSGRIDEHTMRRRLKNADIRLSESGIICNTDGGDLFKERSRLIQVRDV